MGRPARRTSLDPLHARLDDPQRVDDVLVLLLLEKRAELLGDPYGVRKIACGEEPCPNEVIPILLPSYVDLSRLGVDHRDSA